MPRPCIAHSVRTWLPLTMAWLPGQLKHIKAFSSLVLALQPQNLDSFPWEPFYATRSKLGHFSRRVLRRLGVAAHPSLYDRALSRHAPRLLHSHCGHVGWYDLGLAKKHGLKHVVSFYGAEVNGLPTRYPYWRRRYKELFERADLFLCEGPHMARCLARLGCPPEKIALQKLGVDVEAIPYAPRAVGEGPARFLLAARFTAAKGIACALEALGLLKRERPDIRITLIGDAEPCVDSLLEKRRILSAIRTWELESVTRRLGFTSLKTLMEEAARHHIFLAPSVTASNGDTEGGAPITILQAAASGMPVLSTWHCDIPSLVKHGVTGLLSPEKDARGLLENIKTLLDDPGLMADMGRAGRRLVEKEYDAKALVPGLEERYRRLLSSS